MQGRIDQRLLEVLLEISARLEATDVVWALTGSLGHALQGVPLEVDDIDVQTDESGAYEIASCLSEFVVRPIEYRASERIRSHFGEFAVQGVRVEVMGAVQKRMRDRRWGPTVEIEPHRTYVTVAGRPVPVLDLGYESRAYEALGRHDRAALLKRYASRPKRVEGD